ncbi:hypothetical protein [Nocardiopsis xinjiangensis]|uniref:hypothetical protein n=1 Tax=Nocardiopsis xinjiangensis TaxID=124285 RepID=UPI001267BB5F|nr:hypothetical protein [Nocardiopsis xinjiangensis]
MRSFATTARLAGLAAATAALMGAGTAVADDRPIEPAEAPENMERPWPEYAAGGVHRRAVGGAPDLPGQPRARRAR